MKAVVLAAGEGTRLRPLTFLHPKPMIPLGPEPAIHYLLSQLSAEGFDEIVMVVGYMSHQIMDYLGDGSKLGLRISYVVKPEEFRCGTAGSLRLAEHLLDDVFLVAQADTLSEIPLREAVRFHREKGAHATIVLTRVENPGEFGVTILDKDEAITEFQEKPGPERARSNLVSTGFYVLDPDTIDHVQEASWDFAKDLFPRLLKLNERLCGFVSDAFWVDIGSLEGYLRGVKRILEKAAPRELETRQRGREAEQIVLERAPPSEQAARIGSHVLIERDARIEGDAKIGEYCVVKGDARVLAHSVLERSVVLERASVGENCRVVSSVVGQSAFLEENVTVEGSMVGPGCRIGAGATVLEGSRIWPNVQIKAGETVNGLIVTSMEKAFHFYTRSGQYSGVTTSSINGLLEGLEKVPLESIEFHAKRRDFERWARYILASRELAEGMEDLRRETVTGEALRRGLIAVTRKWADYVSSPEAVAEASQ
jgi:NDP-sugar pyrophosphorylase family protein